jgi:Flp pilus assembly protein TadD
MMPRPAIAALGLLLLSACASSGGLPPPSGSADVQRQIRIAQAAERGGQLDVALSIYAQAAERSPGDPELAARHAGVLMQMNEPHRARQVLAEARRRNPADPSLLQAEGRALLEIGDAAAALALFDQHLARAPNDPRSLNGRGIALDLLGRHAEAQASYRRVLALDPRHPVAAGNLALSLVLAGCPDAASATLAGAPRSQATGEWLAQMQSLARSLSPSAPPAAGAELRAALPADGTACPAGT